MLHQWVKDETGALLNLTHIEAIDIYPVEQDPDFPRTTHEVLAIAGNEESYRLTSGDLTHCQSTMHRLEQQMAGYIIRTTDV